MIEKYGHKHLDWLTQIKNTTKRMGVYEYKVLIDLFGNKLKRNNKQMKKDEKIV